MSKHGRPDLQTCPLRKEGEGRWVGRPKNLQRSLRPACCSATFLAEAAATQRLLILIKNKQTKQPQAEPLPRDANTAGLCNLEKMRDLIGGDCSPSFHLCTVRAFVMYRFGEGNQINVEQTPTHAHAAHHGISCRENLLKAASGS